MTAHPPKSTWRSAAHHGETPTAPQLRKASENCLRQGLGVSQPSQVIELSPVYVLEWDGNGCRRRYLDSVGDLRIALDVAGHAATFEAHEPSSESKLADGRHRRGSDSGPDSQRPPSPSPITPADVVRESSNTPLAHTSGFQRLFVVHGLPFTFLKTIRTALDVDPAFLEAHAGRRHYRPLRWRKEACFAHYEYPELVHGLSQHVAEHNASARRGRRIGLRRNVDLLADPVVRRIGDGGDAGAVFCHASLWRTALADVLFLDRPVWKDSMSPFGKARRKESVTRPFTVDMSGCSSHPIRLEESVLDVKLASGDEIKSLEDVLYEMLKDATEGGDFLMHVLAEIAYDHWLEFLEALDLPPQRQMPDIATLYWQILQSLELNIQMDNFLKQRKKHQLTGYADWAGLAMRVQSRLTLAFAPGAQRPLSLPTRILQATDDSIPPKMGRAATANLTARSTASDEILSQLTVAPDENQRSLDRISYLGGILIPLPIVSGILSMGERFGPTGPFFWVFWAVSIPLSFMSVLVIYADTIRRAEVWVQVAAEKVAGLPSHEHEEKGGEAADEKVTDPECESSAAPPPASPVSVSFVHIPGGMESSARRGVQIGSQASAAYCVQQEEEAIDMPTASHPTCRLPHAASAPDVNLKLCPLPPGQQEIPWILERPANGRQPRAWHLQPLGWNGAFRLILMGQKPRRAADVPAGIPTYLPGYSWPLRRGKTMRLRRAKSENEY